MPTLYLLRHCDYANPLNILAGRLPVELSEQGKNDAKKLQQFFADKQLGAIYSSAVLRCQQTAEIVSDNNIPVLNDMRLLETFSAYQGYWGDNWDGKAFHFYRHRNELGGESMEDLQKRMVSFWQEKCLPTQQNVLVCSHGDPLLALQSYLTETPLITEDTKESDIPGWIEKGEFMEVKVNARKVTSVSEPINIL